MKQINKIKDLFGIAKLADEPVLLVGKHGIGKSQTVEEFAKENGHYYQPLFLSHQEVADLIGIPVEKDGNTIWTKPVWLQKMEEASKTQDCVLFLDELNRGQLDVRQVALQLVLNKQIHQHFLPENTFIVAAINPADDDTNDYQVEELDAALLDRFLVVNMESNSKEWIDYAINKKLHPLVIKFISKFPEYLYFEDKNSQMTATNRGWEHLSRLLESFEKNNFKDEEYKFVILSDIISGRIGQIPGYKFLDFYKNEKTFGVKELEKVARKLENEIDRGDFEHVYKLIKDANDPQTDINIDDIKNDRKIKTFFDIIQKEDKKIVEEWNIEPAEVHYLFKNFLPKYLKDTKKYFLEMTLIMYLAADEIVVSYLKQLEEKTEEKIKLGYTIPFRIFDLVAILKEKID